MKSKIKKIKYVYLNVVMFLLITLYRFNKQETIYQKIKKGVQNKSISIKLKRKIARHCFIEERYGEVIDLYDRIDIKLTIDDYMFYYKACLKLENTKQSIKVLENAINNYPENVLVNKLYLKQLIKIRDEKKLLYFYKNIKIDIMMLVNRLDSYEDYKYLLEFNIEHGFFELNKKMCNNTEAIKLINNHELINIVFDTLIPLRKWDSLFVWVNKNRDMIGDDYEYYINLIALIKGEQKKPSNLSNSSQNMEQEFKRFLLFNNGETKIEFYQKKHRNTDKVIITFDSIRMTCKKPPFAYKLLKETNFDIIAIRKRKPKTYQQDLSKEQFLEIVRPIASQYSDRYSYGFSLGAYFTLYYAADLNCKILAMAPRLSIHPEFGRKKVIEKNKMLHEEKISKNNKVEPIIIYDPKNKIDERYIKYGVLPQMPKARLVKLPYGGHSIAPTLLEMKQLKNVVNLFLNNQPIVINKGDRKKTIEYYKNLANMCFEKNHLAWSLSIINIALEKKRTDKRAINIKFKVLMKLKKHYEAENFINKSIDLLPKDVNLFVKLIDLNIEMMRVEKAHNIASESLKKFEKNSIIFKRLKKINSLLQNQS